MSFNSDYQNLRKKRKKNEQENKASNDVAPLVFSMSDIAPVSARNINSIDTSSVPAARTDKREKERPSTWFQKGAFDDGYQFGDVSKTILGTGGDLVVDVAKGATKMLEGVADLGMYGVAGVSDLVGADKFAQKTKKLAQRNFVDDAYSDVDNFLDDYSVFGSKADAVGEALGQIGMIILTGGTAAAGGLSTAGATAVTTGAVGVSSMGSGMSEAYQSGATDGEAVAYGAMSGIIEAGTELIAGGLGKSVKALGVSRGIGGLDDIFAKKLSQKLANAFTSETVQKIVGNSSEYIIKSLAEGGEEVIAGFGSAAAKKLTYMSDKELKELIKDENLLEQFAVGTVASAISQSSALVNSTVKGEDFVTDLTNNEQKVIDKEVENRVAEREASGEKLTSKDKNKIYDDVVRDMKKGYISTETIESVLDKDYQTYQTLTENQGKMQEKETALTDEIESLLDKENPTIRDNERLAEARKELEVVKSDLEKIGGYIGDHKTYSKHEISEMLKGERKGKGSYLSESYSEAVRRGQAFDADLEQYSKEQQEVVKKAIDSGILNNTNRTHDFVDIVAKISADKGVLFDFSNNEKLKESGFAIDGKQVNGFVTKDGIVINMDSHKAWQSTVGHEITHVLEGTDVYAEMQKALFEYAKGKNDFDGRKAAIAELYNGVDGADIDAELTADLVGDYLFSDEGFINNLSVKHRNVFQKIYDEIKYLCKIATAGSKQARELEKVKRAFDKAYKASAEASADMKYSLSDSDGKQLSKGQQEYFKDSKMRDENGNLKVMYHGSQDAGFHVFDAKMSDDDTSFFFVDRNDVAASYSGTSETYEAKTIRSAEDMNEFIESIGAEGYEVVEKDGKFTLLYENERVADSKTAKGIYEEFCWYEGVGEGDANYKVYLNLTNPLVIDAKGRPWNKIDAEFSQEVYDRYQSLTAEEREALTDLAEWEDFSLFNREIQEAEGNELASAYAKMGEDVNIYDLFSVAADNFSEESLKENSRHYLKTRDFAQRAKAQGYDGVIFNNLIDNGGYSNGDEGASTVAIAFSSEQIKSVANAEPTADPDIRFSLSEAVEETKDLIAVHNLQSSELPKALALGGMPMPSIAVIKAQQSHESYGDVSLIFPKDTIDPKKDKNNKVYGGDAWTPTYPSIEYKASKKAQETIRSKIDSLVPYEMQKGLGNIALDYDNISNDLNRHNGDLYQAYKYNYAMQYAFLLDNGFTAQLPMTQKELDGSGRFNNDLIVDVVEKFGVEKVERLADEDIWSNKSLIAELMDLANENAKAKYSGDSELLQVLRNRPLYTEKNFGFAQADSIIRAANHYVQNGFEQTVDYKKATDVIKNAVDEEAYKKWLNNLFADVVEKEGIRNNADYFTPSGNRRSWEALHWENTLENVLKVMMAQNQTGEGFFGGASIFGVANKDYGSIEEVKADSDRLRTIPEDEYEALKESFSNRLVEIANSIKDPNERNGFIAIDNAVEEIVDAVRTSKNKGSILRNMQKWNKRVTAEIVDDIVSLVNDISNMPTGYFEAKPQRAVGFDEVGVFVIPRNADVKLKQELLSRGYAIAEYDPDVEGDRQKVVNSFEEYKFSLSDAGEQLAPFGVPANYLRLDNQGRNSTKTAQDAAPVAESVLEKATTTERAARSDLPISDIDYAPIVDERSRLEARVESLQAEMDSLLAEAKSLGAQFNKGEITEDEHETRVFGEIRPRYNELADERLSVEKQLKALDENETAEQGERLDSFTDADAPPEAEAPYYGDNEAVTPEDPFYDRDIKAVGNRKVKAYMYENPEVKPFFQEAAEWLLSDLRNTTRGERFYTEVDWSSKGVWSGVQRQTSPDIAYLLDNLHYTYKQIEDGLNAIIEDNGKENNACSKKIEFLLNDRLLKGFEDINGMEIPPNQDYINLLTEKQIKEYNEEARQKFFEAADEYAPPQEGAEPTIEAPLAHVEAEAVTQPTEDIAPIPDVSNAGKNVAQGKRSMFSEKQEKRRVARALTEEPQAPKKKARAWSLFRSNFLDKQSVFEDLALKTKNRELMGKANHMLSSESRAQWFIGHGKGNVKALTDIRKEVESSGKLEQFYDYIYHVHNIDRMSLETDENRDKRMAVRQQFQGLNDKQIQSVALTWITKDTTAEEEARIRAAREYVELSKNKDKPVFDYSVTADVSRETVKKYEAANPEFKAWAQDVYDYNKHLRKLLVDGNVISQETADLWEKIYPHFVPIRRKGHDGSAVNIPLDSRKTGVNAPIKRATGGNDDILPLFDTMALRTEQTFKAIAKNQFGLELMHTLDSVIDADEANGSAASVDDVLEGMETQDELLQKGKDGMSPTFTVFENGKRVTFEITEDIYDALKPTSEALMYTNKALNTANNIRRGLITEYNPVFLATNAVKDVQDILINSQHAAKTYAKIPQAIYELAKKGKWYTEYMAAGGEQNTYFDGKSISFKEDAGFKKLIGMPLRAISAANNFVERAPRLAEYIASRESGASVETAMLDAARVTTNFAAGGDVTKFANRNGFTFLNASVQGAMQQVRNVREAKANGFKGWAQLAAKTVIAGLPALLLNGLLWDDDEDYEDLSDYVKDNYYIVAKYGDGQFVRIPKGRTVAVIQDAFEQIGNALTGTDEVDLGNFLELVVSNLAPNNPLDNNILAPLGQALTNKTWYGEDLVPTRLQDLPAAEQFDESTDSISKWLGEKTNTSPIKWNYLLDQYSGAVGDVFLPMMTPEAESGDNSIAGNLLAPWKDKFSTDSVMNNQNVSDFYDTVDELAKNANSSRATDEDILKSKYMNSVNSELSALYKEKREIQNSDLADDEKYAAVREIQEEIVKIAKNGLRDYKHVAIDDGYARVGDRYYRMDDEGKWVKLTDKQIAQQQEVVSGLGIDPSTYWQDKSEYDYAYEYPEKYAVARSVGGYDAYKAYSSELYDIKADKDEYGKSIIGSRKEKVIDWINEQEDLDYGEAIILFKSEYPADDTYNYDIIDYLNGRDDISYEDMETILKELGFNVDKEGNITWD